MTTDDSARSAIEGHIFHRYDDELQALIRLVVDMSKLVSEQIQECGKAIRKSDIERARRVLELDKEVDRHDDAIEDEIYRLLALRHPVARDLRVLMTVNRLGSYLERIGDQARGIAGRLVKLYSEDEMPDKRLLSDLPRMATYVNAMLEMSIRAFETMDVELALEVINMDDELNEQFDASLRALTTYVVEDPRRVGNAVEVVLGLRSLDRMGGHAKSIGRQVIFMAKGINVRHQGARELAAEIRSRK